MQLEVWIKDIKCDDQFAINVSESVKNHIQQARALYWRSQSFIEALPSYLIELYYLFFLSSLTYFKNAVVYFWQAEHWSNFAVV